MFYILLYYFVKCVLFVLQTAVIETSCVTLINSVRTNDLIIRLINHIKLYRSSGRVAWRSIYVYTYNILVFTVIARKLTLFNTRFLTHVNVSKITFFFSRNGFIIYYHRSTTGSILRCGIGYCSALVNGKKVKETKFDFHTIYIVISRRLPARAPSHNIILFLLYYLVKS